MYASPSILSTKTLGDKARAYIQAQGWVLREEDFIEIQRLPTGQISPTLSKDALALFTSENGAIYLPPLIDHDTLSAWSVACLVGKTLHAVHKRFREEQVIYIAKNARELAGAIVKDARFTKAVFFCAVDHLPDLPRILREAGIEVTEFPVYETTGTPRVIDTPFDAVLFFSPSGVDSFFQLNQLRPGTICFAIGETTADTIKNYTDERVIVGGSPTQDDLLASVRFYYDNQQSYE
jgi:uroporphyrinogen-III synthase